MRGEGAGGGGEEVGLVEDGVAGEFFGVGVGVGGGVEAEVCL